VTAPLAARFETECAASGWFPPGAPVLAALSGGLDSQVLLHLLRFGTARRGPLIAVHFDHGMRAASGEDARWVAGLCRAWDVPLLAATSREPLRSETAARDARYAYFAAVAALLPGARIATAHHADDQAETILLRILRGTGLHGLRGIPASRGVFVRPLLPFTRAELEAYGRAAGLAGRDDPTNRELRRPRAAIRHLLLPRLERVRPGAREAVLRLGAAAADAEHRLEPVLEAVENAVVLDRREGEILLASRRLAPYHPLIRAALLRRLLRAIGCAPGRAGTRAALQFISAGRSGARIDLPDGTAMERSFDMIALRRTVPEAPADRPLAVAAAGTGAGRARIGGRELRVEWTMHRRGGVDASDGSAEGVRADEVGESGRVDAGWSTELDPAAVAFPLLLRGWQPGDRIRLPYGRKKLKKLFGELRCSRQMRSRTPVLAEGRDRILWMVGLARSVDAPVGGGTDALRIMVRDD
jgi:tRNA(Ile)-lysidine synthase